MATYSVSYDLNKPGQNYNELYEELQKFSWWHYLDSTWLVVSTLSASEIRDRLKKHLDSSDELLVVRAGTGWASYGLPDKANTWLHQHL